MQKSGKMGSHAVCPLKKGEKKAEMWPITLSTICPSSSPALQKAYCHSYREVPNFDKNVKVHMDFEKRVGGNSKVSVKNLCLDGEIERLIFIGNFNAFLTLSNIMIMYWFHKHKISCLIFFLFLFLKHALCNRWRSGDLDFHSPLPLTVLTGLGNSLLLSGPQFLHLSHETMRVDPWYPNLSAHWNYLGSFRNSRCLHPTSRDGGFIGPGCGLGLGILKSPPGDLVYRHLQTSGFNDF